MSESRQIALIAVTRRGIEQARLLRQRLRTGELHRPAHDGPAAHPWEHAFAGPLAEQVPELFGRCDQLVFFLATGAAVRLIAPCLNSKHVDPGVLTVDESGRFVVPILSGHEGGANAFARRVAGCLGATAVVTTASDVLGGFSPDLLEEAFGWTAEPRERLKAAAVALVNGEPVAIVQEVGSSDTWLDDRELPPHVTFARKIQQLPQQSFSFLLWITDRLVEEDHGFVPDRILWYRPKSLVLGVGCERGISLAALEDGLARFLQEHRFSIAGIDTLASVDVKAGEEALVELARKNGWQTAFYSSAELSAVGGLPNPSEVVERCVGAPGVAEPAALLAAGTDRLLVEKQVLSSDFGPQRMTFALARFKRFADSSGQGRVTFLGAGPGDPELLTLKGRNILARADVVVYAGSLVPEAILRHAPKDAILHNSAPLTLEDVGRILVEAAQAGRRVVRLQSGDTSIYSAIQEQMALLDAAGIAYDVVPGISSYQATAAALGCELTVPEAVQTIILTRGEGQTSMPETEALSDLAQHRATLALFLSARLSEAVQADLLTAYPPDTPVAIAYRVTWPDEKIILTTLDRLHQTMREQNLTRTTLILVGQALKRGENRSRLYDARHAHIFRPRTQHAEQ
jgi:precorrin-4 C11-methyltransferase